MTTTCLDCERPLAHPDSIARRRGRVCQEKFDGDTHVTPVPRRMRRKRLAEDVPLPGFTDLKRTTTVDSVTSLINDRLDQFQKLAEKTEAALAAGAKEAPAAFPYMLRYFVEATYLTVLAQMKPDLAEATAEWLKDALEAADGTVFEVVYDWRQQIAAGDTPWLPQSIIEAL